LPDQHLARNVCYELGIGLDEMTVWNPITNEFECDGDIQDAKIFLWKGYCWVHHNFTPENVKQVKENDPDMRVIVPPECASETVAEADETLSTSYIIQAIVSAPAGSKWAISTEMNSVTRLMEQHTDKEIISLNPILCPCMTMNRITLP